MVNDKVVNYQKAGRRIKAVRNSKKWSQEDLAEKAGITLSYISNIENAHSKASLATFVRIANALEVGLDDLVHDSLIQCRCTLDKQLSNITENCSDYEMQIIVNTIDALKTSLRDAEEHRKRIESYSV